ncbi:MAG: ribosome small subunit-dependent GTPase A [Tenericutes bacterium HGW-Tenericutes-6]|nr:MAG: ribosome small subunit-dependent GTPase A [Tenericutes bacterium HGW-Tenericutes-6]
MRKGFIIKIISNQYTLIDQETKEEKIAQARGKLRHMRVAEDSSFNKQLTKSTKKESKIVTITPKVGDSVIYEDKDEHTWILDIEPRKNDLIRPDISNVDQVLLVFSAIRPDFSYHLLDKFLIIMNQEKLTPVIIISKIDLVEPDYLISLKKGLTYYKELGYDVYYVNSKERIGIDVLTHIFKDKITVLAGQTGVGKSTLLNALMPELNLKTQEISDALGRGKHTTRHTALYPFEGGYIADTPGFSKIEFKIYHVDEVKSYYNDFEALSHLCKFGNKCLHLSEPGCEIKERVNTQQIPNERYQNYVQFCEEVKNQKEKY